MSEPKKQHYVPQMLLKRFTDENGKLYHYVKHPDVQEVLYKYPNNVFFEKHYYAFYDDDNNKDNSLEKKFAKLEGEVDQILEKIVTLVRSGKKPGLSSDEKQLLDQFTYYQWKRTPDAKHLGNKTNIDEALEYSLQEFDRLYGPLSDSLRVQAENIIKDETVQHNARVLAVADPGHDVLDHLDKCGLGFAIISNPKKSFIIGSLPIAKFTLPNHTHIRDPKVEVWFPVASDIALLPAPPWPKGEEKIINISMDQHIRKINEAIASQSTLIAGRSKELISSLARIK